MRFVAKGNDDWELGSAHPYCLNPLSCSLTAVSVQVRRLEGQIDGLKELVVALQVRRQPRPLSL